MAQVTIRQVERILRLCREYDAELEDYYALPHEQSRTRERPGASQINEIEAEEAWAAVLLLVRRDRFDDARDLARMVNDNYGFDEPAVGDGFKRFSAMIDEVERRSASTPRPVTTRTSATANVRSCEYCGEPFTATRSDARYCSSKHRVYALRARARAI